MAQELHKIFEGIPVEFSAPELILKGILSTQKGLFPPFMIAC
jgi:hypothetical protein